MLELRTHTWHDNTNINVVESRIDWACIDLLKASLLNQEPVSVECNDMEYHIALTVVSVYAVHVGRTYLVSLHNITHLHNQLQ